VFTYLTLLEKFVLAAAAIGQVGIGAVWSLS
jgi:hypothetical protein